MKENKEELTRVTQVGIIVKNIEESIKAWEKLLGMKASQIVKTEPLEKTKMKYRGKFSEGRAKLAFFQLENITIELIEPIGGPSTWKDFLEKHGEGIHHIAFNIKSMEAMKERLKEINVLVEQEGKFTGGAYAYTSPNNPLGIIIELLTHQ
ncbi:MAG: VOC family protein [Candidatus Brockarchaeota archaeon]|nr:VOC family protein [Candidatus Brockarchaeota archaeon]